MPRKNVLFTIAMPADERARLVAFAKAIDRPMSWVIRDALAAYLPIAERNARRVQPTAVPASKVGQTPYVKNLRRGKVRMVNVR